MFWFRSAPPTTEIDSYSINIVSRSRRIDHYAIETRRSLAPQNSVQSDFVSDSGEKQFSVPGEVENIQITAYAAIGDLSPSLSHSLTYLYSPPATHRIREIGFGRAEPPGQPSTVLGRLVPGGRH